MDLRCGHWFSSFRIASLLVQVLQTSTTRSVDLARPQPSVMIHDEDGTELIEETMDLIVETFLCDLWFFVASLSITEHRMASHPTVFVEATSST